MKIGGACNITFSLFHDDRSMLWDWKRKGCSHIRMGPAASETWDPVLTGSPYDHHWSPGRKWRFLYVLWEEL